MILLTMIPDSSSTNIITVLDVRLVHVSLWLIIMLNILHNHNNDKHADNNIIALVLDVRLVHVLLLLELEEVLHGAVHLERPELS